MLETMYLAILIGAGLVMAAVFTSWFAFRFGAPILLIFLAIGLIAGEDGLGIEFDNSPGRLLPRQRRARDHPVRFRLRHEAFDVPAGGASGDRARHRSACW